MTLRPLTLGGIATAALAVTLLAGCTATPSSASPAPTTGAIACAGGDHADSRARRRDLAGPRGDL